MLAELREEVADLRDGGNAGLVGRALRVGRQFRPVDRVRRSVVDGHLGVVPDDLDVARVGLKLEPAASVVRRPQASRGSRHQSRSDLAGDRARRKELVRELDPRRDALGRRAGERVVQRLSKRLGRRGRPAATACGNGDRGPGDGNHNDGGDQQIRGEKSKVCAGASKRSFPGRLPLRFMFGL